MVLKIIITIKELNNIAKTFINWYDEIINAYSKNTYGVVITNAMAESNNNYIQTLINIGYGFTNLNVLEKDFYICLAIE